MRVIFRGIIVCPTIAGGRGATHPACFATTTSTAPSLARGTPAPVGSGASRGGSQISGETNRLYAMRGCQSSKASPDVVTEPEQLHESFSVSTPIGESIVVAQVYRDCVVMVRGRDTMANLIELGMVDFDVIIGMNWIYSCFANIDCRTRTVRFEFPNEPVINGKGMMWCRRVFPKELHWIPPDREIDFGIDVMSGTQPISIPPYIMPPIELKELKEQLKD
ncbi:uncharacterized protein [Nicotiana tomentosiformis]|uniref:uncharacterized protein n=1 Tax=Nicotiana tomentosiformis TaxID=4098 RepID=UPI00388CB954